MKKLFLMILMLLPIGLCAQLSVSGIGGDNGYTALRASFYYHPSGENYAIIPKYAYYKDTDTEGAKSVSRYGLRGEYYLNSFSLGLEGAYVPDSNGYESYSGAGDVHYYFFKNRHRELFKTLYVGVGGSYTKHKQKEGNIDPYSNPLARSFIPEYDIDETRANVMAGADLTYFYLNTIYSKGFYSNTPPPVENAWMDLPFFTSVNRTYLDYYWDSRITIPLDLFNIHGGYSLARNKGETEDFQSLSAGVTLTIDRFSITGNIEVMDFDETNKKRTYYSLSGGFNF